MDRTPGLYYTLPILVTILVCEWQFGNVEPPVLGFGWIFWDAVLLTSSPPLSRIEREEGNPLFGCEEDETDG